MLISAVQDSWGYRILTGALRPREISEQHYHEMATQSTKVPTQSLLIASQDQRIVYDVIALPLMVGDYKDRRTDRVRIHARRGVKHLFVQIAVYVSAEWIVFVTQFLILSFM